MAGRTRRAFTLIELLVVMSIIAMVLALAAPAVSNMLRTTSILAATDILRSAVSSTRSTAVSTRRSCTVDIRNSPDEKVTEKVSTSAILTAEDFESYDDDKAENIDEIDKNWAFYPDKDAWEIYAQRTREAWVGRRKDINDDPYPGNAYAWNLNTGTSPEPAINVETMILARFRARQVTDARKEWGFGILANFSQLNRRANGYRIAVRVKTSDAGWNTYSRAKIEKISNSSNPASENVYEASDPAPGTDEKALELESVRELDNVNDPEVFSAVAPGVWYWMKMSVKREEKIVEVAGKVWVEGAPEPSGWTVGPVGDIWSDADPKHIQKADVTDNFNQGGEPHAGGFCGVWTFGAELAVDDFSVDWRKSVLLPKGIHMQPKKYDPDAPAGTGEGQKDAFDLVKLDRYQAGSFPLTYRPDGTAASMKTVLLIITNIKSGDRRAVQIDHNTGRISDADVMKIQR